VTDYTFWDSLRKKQKMNQNPFKGFKNKRNENKNNHIKTIKLLNAADSITAIVHGLYFFQ